MFGFGKGKLVEVKGNGEHGIVTVMDKKAMNIGSNISADVVLSNPNALHTQCKIAADEFGRVINSF